MIREGKCYKCGFIFTDSSRQFYCCNKDKKYCILCRRIECSTCKKLINKQVKVPTCRECFQVERNPQNIFEESMCNSYYCGKCLVTKIMKKTHKKPNHQIMFPCGHLIDSESVRSFLSKFCTICGAKYNSILDYELINEEKCCFMCFKYEKDSIQNFLLNCMGCGDVIKKIKDAGTMENDFILCSKCTTFSKMEEQHFQEIQHHEEDHKKKKEKSKQQKKVEEKSPKKNSSNNHKEAPSIISEQKEKPQSQIKKQEKKQKIKDAGKVQMQTLKQRQKQRQTSSKQKMKRTILSKFPSQKQNKPKMKKHMSMETYVEKMKIQIEDQKQEDQIECQGCGYLISKLESLKDQKDNLCCRLCFTFSSKTENVSFSSKLIKIEDERGGQKKDDIRRQFKSGQKHSVLLPVPDERNNTKFGKLSGFFDNNNNQKIPQKITSSTTTYYKDECTKCHKVGEAVIRTVKNGNVCFTCYYKEK